MVQKKSIMVKEEALKFLKENKVGVFSTISSEGEPQSAAVFYIIDNDFNFYFATGRESRKFKNIEKNNKVSFVVGVGPDFVTVQGWGTAEVTNEKTLIFKLMAHIGVDAVKAWPLFALPHMALVMVKVTPKFLRFLNLDVKKYPKTYREAFYKIIPEDETEELK